MVLKSLTAGTVSGTGFVKVPSQLFGGALISADSTNAATIVIRKSNDSQITTGDIIFNVVTKIPLAPFAPFHCGDWIYYNISGTSATAQLYEWVP